jgi:hypothetical protein
MVAMMGVYVIGFHQQFLKGRRRKSLNKALMKFKTGN